MKKQKKKKKKKKESRATFLPSLWAFVACSRVNFAFTFTR
jgi:hypothetical protein